MKNPKKKIQSTAVTIALLIAGDMSIRAQSESSREAAGDVAKPQTSSPTDFVDTLNSTFGKQTTQRATHAKGIVVLGKFTPIQTAQSLSKAPHFRHAVPVTVRFSDTTGIPTLPDADEHATPHGMALKFHLPDGSETDLVTHSFNGFPAATADEMRQFFIAVGSSGAGVSLSDTARHIFGGASGGENLCDDARAAAGLLRDAGIFRRQQLQVHQCGWQIDSWPLPDHPEGG